MSSHLATILPAKGAPFTIQPRPTPSPGPGELLIAVKSVALNPADIIMRDNGLFIPSYPTVTGFDMAGLVLEVGDGVPSTFKPGSRIAAYSASAWKGCDSDYGPFQERCLVPWQHAAVLPEDISWDHAASLPVAVQVPLSAWDAMGISRPGETTAPGTEKNEALLIWGASSSVGTMGVQTARILRDDPSSSAAAVYAVAGKANLDYVRSLGADRVFDYKSSHIVDSIIDTAKDDWLVVRYCFLAAGDLAQCQAVMKSFLAETKTAKIASAPSVPTGVEVIDGLETIFVMPSHVEEERLEQFRCWMSWLSENLEKRTIRPSPELRVVGKGLETISAGLDQLEQGVSCTKLVVEIY
ncbi:hypothetical protein BDW74DRAFT_172658 [Aspergillus multicolor]|uniref:zinc-binding alcohol dehydrogenase family protein n=1 Tax=Aspergillus multicolor TaxID=41759 RepID=UPI003CCCDC89